ncbi:MAG: DNA adenine methylase [Ruminococcus sp.]|nr:DNA adenine methylase [Ruminococcus sp.]
MRLQQTKLKPILKWAGGKTQLLDDIIHAYPVGFGETIKRYAEPFVGGGAVLLDILSKYSLDAVYISDVNAELINMYMVVRDQIDELITILSGYQTEYLSLDREGRKNYYYNKRDDFNNLIATGKSKSGVKSAALFIFLNRTCFNGLYRANKNGFFNVPKGDQESPIICNEDNLRAVSAALAKVQIVCGDYTKSKSFIDANTLVYLDPPYRPLKGRDSFISYTENEFDDSCQRELAGFIEEIDAKGAYIILSNSDPKNVDPDDDFFDDLYADYDVKRINAKRKINRNADHRGYITELLIKNY